MASTERLGVNIESVLANTARSVASIVASLIGNGTPEFRKRDIYLR
jgi:hypothetical protein